MDIKQRIELEIQAIDGRIKEIGLERVKLESAESELYGVRHRLLNLRDDLNKGVRDR